MLERLNYFDGQFLTAEDFATEQAYHLAALRRHAIGHHSWGIVQGLDLHVTEGRLTITPGLAIDGYGRELVLPRAETVALDLEVLLADDPPERRVWFLYDRLALPRDPDGRWEEAPRCMVETPGDADPPLPISPRLRPEDLSFGPTDPAPDDPAREWPVYLGRLLADKDAPGQVRLDPAGRPYAGVVAQEIASSDGDVRLRLAAQEDAPVCLSLLVGSDADGQVTALTVDRKGGLALAGGAQVAGDVRLGGGVAFTRAAEPPSDGANWQLCRTATPEGGDELRLEIGPAANDGNGALGGFVVGAWSEEADGFRPILSMTGDGVTVHGDLVVEGRLNPKPAPPGQETLSPDARASLKEAADSAAMAAVAGEQAAAQTEDMQKAVEQAAKDGPLIKILKDVNTLLGEVLGPVAKLLGLPGAADKATQSADEKKK